MNKHAAISLHHRLVQGKGNIVSDMGGEKVMLSVHNGKYYNLGEIGGRIWELMEHPTTAGDVVSALTAEYEVSRQDCEQHVISFLEMLSRENLIEVGATNGND